MTQGSTGPEPAFVIVTGSSKSILLAFIWSINRDLSMHWARMRLILPRRQHISHPTRRATHKLGDTRLRNDTTRHHTIQRRSDLLHGPFLSVCHRPARQGHPHSPHTAPQPPHAAPTLDAQGHAAAPLATKCWHATDTCNRRLHTSARRAFSVRLRPTHPWPTPRRPCRRHLSTAAQAARS